MYKSRITKWGLDKKNKKSDMALILCKKTQRDAIGKDTTFRVRNRPVSIEEVHRYFKRKGGIQDLSPPGTPPDTPPHISYRTPSPVCSPNSLERSVPVLSPHFSAVETIQSSLSDFQAALHN